VEAATKTKSKGSRAATSDRELALRLGSLMLCSFGSDGGSVIRAIDETGVEDPDDRRVRRVSLTADGQKIADELMAARLAGLERFVETLAADERRKLEAALEVLLERDDIADIYRTHRKRAFK
jgi:hypothetical protein